MDKVVQGAAETVSVTFSGVSAGAVTADVVDDLGEVLLEDAATTDVGEGVYSLTLSAVQTAALGRLEVRFSGDPGGVAEQHTARVEVVGARYATLADLRGRAELGNAASFSDELLTDTLTGVEDRIERATGVSWVPRYRRETHAATGRSGRARLERPEARELVAVIVDGETVADISSYKLLAWGELVASTWSRHARVQVAYTHGYDPPLPHDLFEATLDAVAVIALRRKHSRVPKQAEFEERGSWGWSEVADLKRGRPFGIPEVDSVVMSHLYPVVA